MSSGSDRGGEQTHLASLRPVLEARARLLREVRRFFGDRGFLEVETPVRIPQPAIELHIDALPSAGCYLRTSPELHMKRLLAAGYERIFQVGPCFRAGEYGAWHSPEFALLEWYRANADYLDILRDMEELIVALAGDPGGDGGLEYGGVSIDLRPPWPRVPVAEAFRRFAGWDPTVGFDEDRFTLDMVRWVEPNLPPGRPVVLMDFPVQTGALARAKPGHPAVAERWELYIGGLELANAFSELVDPAEQRRRFTAWQAARRAAGRIAYGLDEAFLDALVSGIPPSGGVALGIDRLVMLFTGTRSLDALLPFRTEAAGGAPALGEPDRPPAPTPP